MEISNRHHHLVACFRICTTTTTTTTAITITTITIADADSNLYPDACNYGEVATADDADGAVGLCYNATGNATDTDNDVSVARNLDVSLGDDWSATGVLSDLNSRRLHHLGGPARA